MKNRRLFRVLLLPLLLALGAGPPAGAQQAIPSPRYVPPDIVTDGIEAHYEHMAVIETDCRTDDEARALWVALTERGALISIISSPGRMLGWVPPESRAEVLSTRISGVAGSVGVLQVAYDTDALDASAGLAKRAGTEADEAVRDFLEWVRAPMTPEREVARQNARQKYELLKDVLPNDDPVDEVFVSRSVKGGGGNELLISSHATRAYGLLRHTSFFLESQAGTGSWNWPSSVYHDYRVLYTQAISYWSAFAAEYGRTLTTAWHLYAPTHWVCQINGEPVTVGEASFIPTVLDRVTSGSPENIGGLDPRHEWALKYNRHMRSTYGANESIIGFIAYKATNGEGIWPHASVVNWNDGKKEGLYFALDNQYWQAVPDPLANPYRNVIAHEIGHLWGCPDEYHSTMSSCTWSYRGMANYNCQVLQSAPGHPGSHMRGFDGMMKGNYTGGTSLCTPVHSGVISASSAVPIRRFRTAPAGLPLTVENCDGGTRTFTESIYIPVSHDYCMTVSVHATRTVGSTTWYMDYWEVKRESGSSTEYRHYGTELPSSALQSSRANPIVDVIAHYTDSPPNFQTSNTTLSAWLSHFNHNVTPQRCIALRWRSNYDMTEAGTKIEYQRGSSWVQVQTSNIVLYHPTPVSAYRWTGVRLHSVPGSGGDEPIQPNREYRFRIRGVFNTVEGSPSVVATVTTRPASPADSAFCYDVNEPNSTSSPKVLPSMGPGIDPYTVRGAVTIDGATGEFSWYRPKRDYYRITAIGLSSSLFGTKLHIECRVRDQSDFRPDMTWRRAGTTTEHDAIFVASDNAWVMNIGGDGEYIISVGADITNISGMYDLADRWTGKFGFGEYELSVGREVVSPIIAELCVPCVRVRFPRPFPGLVVMEPFPPPELVIPTWPGWKPTGPRTFGVRYIPPAGHVFESFEGELHSGKQNPFNLTIDPQTPPGEHAIYPRTTKMTVNAAELVVIHPEGPDGPLEERGLHSIGASVMVEAEAPEDFIFVGWGGDTSAVSNPLPVTMWKHKTLIAYYRPRPCVPEEMPKWTHIVNVTNARQGQVRLEYGMQDGAGDGLEPGQSDLPPTPPPGTFDVRWINIPGSQGTTTDIRAIKKQHTYQGSIQTGAGTTPVIIQWSTPPLSPSFTMRLRIPALAVDLDMHTVSSYTLPDEGKYIVYVDVKEPDCPPPSIEPDIEITTERYDPKDFPCVELELLVRDRRSHAALPYFNPYRLSFYERNGEGAFIPARVSDIRQLDSTFLVRLCTDPENRDPEREIVIVPDEDKPDIIPDTTDIKIPTPIPDPDDDMFQFTRKNSGDWEMVSLPVKMTASLIASLYPDPATKLYLFNTSTGMYEGAAEMKFGAGYWLKTNTASTLFLGNEVTSNTLSGLSGIGVAPAFGWNMIGGITHKVPVSGIAQSPAGSMKAIFGWEPASGYVIPADVEPGEGYWVRTDPGASLTLSGSAARGNAQTLYQKIAATIPTAGLLRVRPGQEGGQTLRLGLRALREDEVDLLSLPAPPPHGLFDARAKNGTLFLQPGENSLRIQGDRTLQIIFTPVEGVLRHAELCDEFGTVLHQLRTDRMSIVPVNASGHRSLLFRYSVAEASPRAFALQQNYPNPLRAGEQTSVRYSLDRDAVARLEVYDLLGRRVATVVDDFRRAGQYEAQWDGRGDRGDLLPAGLYMYRLEAGGQMRTRRCTIVR
ncbi:MAG: FlgD immunoglobulin-like domain containing protein [Bacteroidota bacterium]|nr:FlgD immunoglobulin-like domain containing protein [Bacteroidota bacterium]